MAVAGELQFELADGWEQIPDGYNHRDVAGVAVDSRDRVYLITRGEPRVIVYEPDGRFVTSWGEGIFSERTHGITVGPDDSVYCVDDADHTARRFTPDGQLLLTLGTSRMPSDTGYDGNSLPTITHGGPPFNRPTNLAVALSGDLYVSDGYGNARVHRFSATGELIQSWGEPGTGPGQFNLPHGIWVTPDSRVLVADRENDRIQVFDLEGRFVEEWTHVQRPTQVFLGRDGLLYVSELWWRAGQHSYVHGDVTQDRFARVSVLDLNGRLVGRFGGGAPGTRGNFTAPHSISVDSQGNVYVGEVTHTFGISTGAVTGSPPTLQKFARV